MKIFVTGATGFIGSQFLKSLTRQMPADGKIYVFARSPIDIESKQIIKVTGELSELRKYSAEICECDFVFHIAANAVYGGQDNYQEVNVEPTCELIDILKASKHLQRFIFVSTIGAVDRGAFDFCANPLDENTLCHPRSKYGRSKRDAEVIVRSSGLPFTIIRPTWVYGRGMRVNSHIHKFVSMAADGKRRLLFSVGFPGRVSLIHVDDLVEAFIRCMQLPEATGRTIFAATENISIGEIFQNVWSQVHGERIRSIRLPGIVRAVRFFHRILPLSVANLFADYLCAETSTFANVFKIEKPITLSEGLRDVVDDNIELHGAIVITGANSGIGLALARRLAAQSEKLVLIDKATDQLNEFQREHIVLNADLTNQESFAKIAAQIPGRVKGLVNNAGIGYKGTITSLTPAQIEQTVAVNCAAPVLLTQALSRKLVKDQSAIVNVASSVAYNPLPGMSIYAASKAFALSWSEALSEEWRNSNRVITISPAGTATNFQKTGGVSTHAGGLLSADDVAQRIERSLIKGTGHKVIGLKAKILLAASWPMPMRWKTRFWGTLFAKLR